MPLLSKTCSSPSNTSSRRAWLPVGSALLLGLAVLPPAVAQSGKGSNSEIADAEVAKRLADQERARLLIAEGDVLAAQQDHCGAADKFREAAQLLRKGAAATITLRSEAVKKFARSGVACAKDQAARGAYDQAKAGLAAILADDMAPNDKPAQTLLKQLDDPDRHNPSLTPQHRANAGKVGKLLQHAGALVELGDYNAAEAAYQQVLATDVTNTAARRGLERTQLLIQEHLKSSRDETRLRMLNAVDRTWETKVPSSAKLSRLPDPGSVPDALSPDSTVAGKLHSIIIPRISVADATMEEVVGYLRARSIELDPSPDENRRGVNIVWKPGGGVPGPITLDLRNVTLAEALRSVCDMSGARMRTDAAFVSLSMSSATAMETRQFRVPPGFLSTAASMTATGDTGTSDPFATPDATARPKLGRLNVRAWLEGNGITFPDGARAAYSPALNVLTLVNTPDNLELVAGLVEGLASGSQRQVFIEVLLLKATQTNLREAGYDILLEPFNVGGERVFAGGGTSGNSGVTFTPGFSSIAPNGVPFNITSGPMTAGLRSSVDLSRARSIDDLIALSGAGAAGATALAATRPPSMAAIGGVFTDPRFQAMVRQLDQKKGIDLSVANKVIVKSGQRATAFSGREFIYPTEFDPPQIPQTVVAPRGLLIDPDTGEIAGAFVDPLGQPPVTPATPSAFETKLIGSSIEVEATIGEDGHTVDLNLAVSFNEFDGFINYGTPITSNDESQIRQQVLTENRIIQPVFSKAAANVQVLVYDGHTVAIGGLAGDRTETIEDKVPVFSSIPLIGRFFKSDVTRDSRSMVMYFVTVKVVDPAGERANITELSASGAPAAPAAPPFDTAILAEDPNLRAGSGK